MKTQGSGIPYSHDLVHVPDQTVRIDFGWTCFFQKVHEHVPGDRSVFRKMYVPKCNLKSIQHTFYASVLESLGSDLTPLLTLSSLQKESVSRMYSHADLEDMLRHGFDIDDRYRPTTLKKVQMFFHKEMKTLHPHHIKTFINRINYSMMKKVQVVSGDQYLGGLFEKSKQLEYDISGWKTDPNCGSWLHWKTLEIDSNIDVDNILLAGRTEDLKLAAFKNFGTTFENLNLQ